MVAESTPRVPKIRLNVNLPKGIHDELRNLAERSGRSMTDIVRTGLGLAVMAFSEAERSNILAIADAEGTLIKQIVLPR